MRSDKQIYTYIKNFKSSNIQHTDKETSGQLGTQGLIDKFDQPIKVSTKQTFAQSPHTIQDLKKGIISFRYSNFQGNNWQQTLFTLIYNLFTWLQDCPLVTYSLPTLTRGWHKYLIKSAELSPNR